ncbi:uncharacterized protein LOC103041488 [Astyanax mexicanus]|uniref:uncharacterized protein LOC103041488 n=1 Tax=Astyanax mexicanus TaxID=7994 RepID=UPI0020CB4428|nr:uncharacterized protein LOC103041488 [Astyanax mexicanus]
MTDTQPRDGSAGNSSDDDEPLSEMAKRKKAPEKTQYSEEAHKKELSKSEDDESLLTLMKRKNKKTGTEETAVLDSNKTRSPRKQKTEVKTEKHRQASPSQKTSQKRSRKGKRETRKTASAPPKKRGCAKQKDTQRQAPSCDSSDNEPLVELVKKKRQPEMKRAVVLLKRMSNRDIINMITQGHECSQVQKSTVKVDEKSKAESSDEEPLSHKVKRLKQHSKPVRGRATTDVKSEADSSDEEPLTHRVKQHSKPVRGRVAAGLV